MKKRFSLLCILFSMILCISGCKTNISKNGIEIDSITAKKIINKVKDKYSEKINSSNLKFTIDIEIDMNLFGSIGDTDIYSDIYYSKLDNYFYEDERSYVVIDEYFDLGTVSWKEINYYVTDYNYHYLDSDNYYIHAKNYDETRKSHTKEYILTETDAQQKFNLEASKLINKVNTLFGELFAVLDMCVSNNEISKEYYFAYYSKGNGHLYIEANAKDDSESNIIKIENYEIKYVYSKIEMSKLPEYSSSKYEDADLTTEYWFNFNKCKLIYPNLDNYKITDTFDN